MRIRHCAIAVALLLSAVLPSAAASAASDPAAFGQPVVTWSAQEDDDHAAAGNGSDLTEPVLWSIAGTLIGAAVMALLYGLKRAVGGFPKNPSWVAPISIERSSTFLDDVDVEEEPNNSGEHH